MILPAVALAAFAVLLAWTVGGLVLRLSGITLGLAGFAGILASGVAGGGLLVFAIGAVLWLAGQWHYALRHQEYKSPLARHLFVRWLPALLDPTRQWTSAVFDERPRRERSGRGGDVR